MEAESDPRPLARARFGGAFSAWPAGLAVCHAADWLKPSEDVTDELTRMYACWGRWVEARADYLRSLGMRPDDAMHDSVGDFPRPALAETINLPRSP